MSSERAKAGGYLPNDMPPPAELVLLGLHPDQIDFGKMAAAPLLTAQHLTPPDFTGPLVATAVFSIAIMAIATVPESTAHLYQISLYAERLAAEQGREPY